MDAKKFNRAISGDDKDARVSGEIERSTQLMIRLADALLRRFYQGGDQTDLNVAILLYRETLERRSIPLIRRQVCVVNLRNALTRRFKKRGRPSDLDEAIHFNREALKLFSKLPPFRSECLNSLASTLLVKFNIQKQYADLDEAISLYRQAINSFLPSSDLDIVDTIANLATSLVARSEYSGKPTDLDEAISLHMQALELRKPSHPERCDILHNLAHAMYTRFMLDGGKRADLEMAISVHRQALELRRSPHPKRSNSLTSLSDALSTRFEHDGEHRDIDEAISLHRQALQLQLSPLPDQLRAQFLTNLAIQLRIRFQHTSQKPDLDESLCLHREALKLVPPPNPYRSLCLNNLAIALTTLFEQECQENSLDEAISMHRQALQLGPSPLTDGASTIHNLAAALSTRFERGGRLMDLDEAISLNREALQLLPPPHPDRYRSLTNLAAGLHLRFQRTSQTTDLDEAVFLHEEALRLPHPERSLSLNNLATVLWRRFEHGGQKFDLDQAISMHKEALQLRPPAHAKRPMSLNNLAAALVTRFRAEGQRIDLDETIDLSREALQLRPSSHSNRYMSLHNLATHLTTRFHLSGQTTDLEEAISLTRQGLDLLSLVHPSRSGASVSLGKLLIQARYLDDNNSEYLENAMSLFTAAAKLPSQSPSDRLSAARAWVRYADEYQHISAIDAYEVALQALPQVAALSFDLQSRQKALTAGTDGLARDASRCAIRSGNFGKAIEFLESGRSIFWSQVLSLRSSFDELHNISPALADNLRDTAFALEQGSHRDISSQISDNLKKLSLDRDVFRLNRLNEEWEKGINDARKLPGFEDFLRPSSLSSLQVAASKNPIVLLVDNNDGGHCLILTATFIHHIPLITLRTDVLQELISLVQVAACQFQRSQSATEKTHKNVLEHFKKQRGMRFEDDGLGTSDGSFRFVLNLLWEIVVKPVIDFLDLKKFGEMPILQWCPTGAFTFLPIHAAGCYQACDDKVAIESASDYFISTYIPTIGTLLAPRSAPSPQNFKMMVVVQSAELPSTKQELEKIQKHAPSNSLVKFGVPGAVANVEAVASHLSDASIVHFACHGKQDRLKPLNSGLSLHDGLLSISRIMKEKIPSGTLAFLCACETAMGDQHLPDEAMSLGASFLFSGFRRVVATMWEMRDEDGPTIADIFYEELFRGPDGEYVPEPDTTKSAQALHEAVKKLRSQNVGFSRWVPFIHMGM